MSDDQDQLYLNQAIQLAMHSVELGGGPFGAVIVKDDVVIGQGHNQVTIINDPTAHAEVSAIRNACANQQHFDLSGATLYASCEPCPMCFAAIYWARIKRIVYAATGSEAAEAGFDDNRIAIEICQPYESRSIKMEHHDCKNRQQSFMLWQKKSDKIAY